MKLPSPLVLDCAYMHERTKRICHLSRVPRASLPEAHSFLKQEYTALGATMLLFIQISKLIFNSHQNHACRQIKAANQTPELSLHLMSVPRYFVFKIVVT